jgi:hypothetical protein
LKPSHLWVVQSNIVSSGPVCRTVGPNVYAPAAGARPRRPASKTTASQHLAQRLLDEDDNGPPQSAPRAESVPVLRSQVSGES